MVEKDEFCTCPCHDRDKLSYRDCPECYFSDGNSELNRRLEEHAAEYPGYSER